MLFLLKIVLYCALYAPWAVEKKKIFTGRTLRNFHYYDDDDDEEEEEEG